MTCHGYSLSRPCRMVRIYTRDGHPIHGAIFEPEQKDDRVTAVIHSHGTLGNFYFNPFIYVFAEFYNRNGIALLCFNHTTHDGIAESDVDGRLKYIGGSISEFATCLDDFNAVRRFLSSIGYRKFVMQGHSLGCERVVFDQRRSNENWPIILLAPVNSYATQTAWCRDRLETSVEELTASLRANPTTRLRIDIYGSPSKDPEWDYFIPIYEKAYLSFATSEAIQYFCPEGTVLQELRDTLIVFAATDAFHDFYEGSLERFFHSIAGKGSKLAAFKCNHDFDGALREVCETCVDFIKKQE